SRAERFVTCLAAESFAAAVAKSPNRHAPRGRKLQGLGLGRGGVGCVFAGLCWLQGLPLPLPLPWLANATRAPFVSIAVGKLAAIYREAPSAAAECSAAYRCQKGAGAQLRPTSPGALVRGEDRAALFADLPPPNEETSGAVARNHDHQTGADQGARARQVPPRPGDVCGAGPLDAPAGQPAG
ncbi:unnamed protein product, partial [Amoebophrya sp. A120]